MKKIDFYDVTVTILLSLVLFLPTIGITVEITVNSFKAIFIIIITFTLMQIFPILREAIKSNHQNQRILLFIGFLVILLSIPFLEYEKLKFIYRVFTELFR